jgi:hypothetical protein
MLSINNVLPPYTHQYKNNLAPISSNPTGLYNSSMYGAAYKNVSGSVLPSVNGGILGGTLNKPSSCKK